ncbi:CDP-6-deoxy-delta-3,4-glucoseen reductase [Pandoraea apista]|uniref:2Fe-2S iron-sulfur cluster binding domain-containing protein n=1 Tax=Pandoraea apista TaxID=93218 RepID=A0ABX9ZUZ9_9BURK|nr:CDP-6-deoxy-delta-3,4-glucoseen reductase [Pandoraea apista]RRJ32922.1 CDP-6-deoxy-delta-3,4-glucoseen reductase [Pandoraea apista]RRJ81773.1 CDP-6-deoxy-delta-3,4-glucoseen reductase [Pandoraea apista]RSD11109.1 2Fe-2S iron-sulfur cluster binding domain-containing protein [Pandoraea apista]RSD24314.1 2Fe-2S iron-sulfur cluster binding domain-containing protein [Pandoraea apista]
MANRTPRPVSRVLRPCKPCCARAAAKCWSRPTSSSEPDERSLVSYRITWIEAQRSFEAAADETVLEAARRAGVVLPSACEFGGCGTCRVKLQQGRVQYEGPPDALSQDEANEGYALLCQARAVSDLAISTERPLAAPAPARHRKAEVVSTAVLSPEVTRLVLAVDDDEPWVFRPGQYVNVLLGEAGPRSFSIASRPEPSDDPRQLELHIRRIDGGYFTQTRLSALRAGDRLDIEAPMGGFGYHEDDYRPIVMVATGTGIAPLRSMLVEMLAGGDTPPIDLYWGGRNADALYLHDELTQLAQQHEDFRYVPVLSRPDATWQGARGYVQDAVVADHPDLSEHALYLCGSPVMIADAKRAFVASGASVRYLYVDSFTFQHSAPVQAAA